MSQRIVVASLVGAVVVAGAVVGGVASAEGSSVVNLHPGSARYTAPTADHEGTLTYTAKAGDDSGIESLKVVAWPKSSDLEPKEEEVARSPERATCEKPSGKMGTCTYTLKVSRKEAAGLAKGTWHVAALAKAKDGGTAFAPESASFRVPR